MKLYATVELFGSILEDVKVCKTRKEAVQAKIKWNEEQGIKNEADKEVQFDKGNEFHIRQVELK